LASKYIAIYARKTARVFLLVVVLFFLFTYWPLAYAEGEADATADKYAKPPKIKAKSAILIDANTGNVLYAKKADTKRAPASCTKILTGLLAIENLDPNEIVTVTDEAYNTEGSSVGLVPGEEVRAEDLIYAAMLESGNDAAMAIAIGTDGSVEAFANRMNERVAGLGLSRSHFANPHGLDDPEHYTTARDLAFIAREAMRNQKFRDFVTTYTYTMPETNLQPERLMHNSNRMLYDESRKVNVYGEDVPVTYPDNTGIKTGYTSKAGNCLVSGVNRNGLELISVVLKSKGINQYSDTISLLEYGLHNFEEVTYLNKGDTMFERPVEGADEHVSLVISDDLKATVNKNKPSSYHVDAEVTGEATASGIKAPVKSGDVLGKAWVKSADGHTLAIVDLVAKESVEAKSGGIFIGDEGVGTLSLVFRIIGIACLVAIVIVVISIVRATIKRHRRRRNRMYGAKLSNAVDPREVRRIKNINRTRKRRR
jgi:D-alanyl-D-alanine carboxypeptidase (penicillin-binding protein 5/6)